MMNALKLKKLFQPKLEEFMNKKLFLLFILINMSGLFFSAEIIVSDIAVYDKDGKKIEMHVNPSKLIYEKLNKHWFEGLIHFSYLDEDKYGISYTIIDANKICSVEHKDFIIYGYIKKEENNWFINLKLYDKERKIVSDEFYASDSLEQYERLINIISEKIVSGLEEITGINQIVKEEKDNHALELKLPASLYYWTPIDTKWSKKLLGIAGINAGLDFYPPFPKTIVNGMLIDFSGRLNLSWNFAINQKDIYPLFLNNISISIPALAHIHFDTRHCVYLGIGFSYELELMNIEPKYEKKQFFYQNMFSFENITGYEFSLTEKINLFSEIIIDYHIANDGFISIKPSLGASFNLYRKQK